MATTIQTAMQTLAVGIASALKTLRSVKIPYTGGMVLFDWSLTIAAAYLIARRQYNYANVVQRTFIITALLVLISIPIHFALGIPTVTNYYLGLSEVRPTA